MKRVLLALALIGMCAGIASAQPTNLAGGVFITHYPPGIVYSDDLCVDYAQLIALTSCDQQNPMIPTGDPTIWWVIAAWEANDKVWCGTEFGLQYSPATALLDLYGQCPGDALTIPGTGFPGPNTGIAIATTATPWSGNFQPILWLRAYAYEPGLVQLGINPATGFGGFTNCMTPPAPYAAACFGAMGMLTPGVECCPVAPAQHACCVNEECFLVDSSEACDAMGGVDHPDWPSCDNNPCFIPPVPAVCCVGTTCYIVPEEECTTMGGVFHSDLPECLPETCGPIVPVDPSSWGTIKAIYR